VRAACIANPIEAANLRDRVAAQETRSQYQQQQREQERLIEGHAEMAECHQYAPEDDRVATAEYSIADQPAQHRREVDQAYVKAKCLRGESVNRQRPGDPFQNIPICREAEDPFDVPRQQQLVRHVERQQRA
jgi:hypothetical protein